MKDFEKSNLPNATDVAASYQRKEFLLRPYPTYGVDRLLLENSDIFDNQRSHVHDEKKPLPPVGIKELFNERTKRAPQNDSVYRAYLRDNSTGERLDWLLEQWRENYLLPRTIPADVSTEIDAWKIIAQKVDITDDDVRVEDERHHDNDVPRLVIEDTHLVQGLCGSASLQLIVPPGVELTGDYGHCSVLDTNKDAFDFHRLPKMGSNVLELLLGDGDIKQGQKSVARSLARSALLD